MLHPILGFDLEIEKHKLVDKTPWFPLKINLLPEELNDKLFKGKIKDGRLVIDKIDEEYFEKLSEAGHKGLVSLIVQKLSFYWDIPNKFRGKLVEDSKVAHENSEFTKAMTDRAKKLLDSFDGKDYTVLVDCMDLLCYSEHGYDVEEMGSLDMYLTDDPDECEIHFEDRFREKAPCPRSIAEHFALDDGTDYGCDPDEVFIFNWTKWQLAAGVKVLRQQIEFLEDLHKDSK